MTSISWMDSMDKKETVWLTLDNLSMLFDRDKSVISRHIRNIFNGNELFKDISVAKNAIQIKGQIHYVLYFNLDVIISAGYRVKSERGVIFESNLFLMLFSNLFVTFATIKLL